MTMWQKTKKLVQKIGYAKRLIAIQPDVKQLTELMLDDYLRRNLYENPKYHEPKKLNRYEYQVYSQSGEDGILSEIFGRIGTTNRVFVEFGVGDGLQNNTCYLLTKDWSGFWLDGNREYTTKIRKKLSFLINQNKLQIREAFITPENVESLFRELGVPREFDLLSIDVDGNDYWLWNALEEHRPRVITIEYNAIFRPDVKWVMKYSPEIRKHHTQYFGASLKSLEILGAFKGYKLVGCSFTGINAFFVRDDLVENKFSEPFNAENHYEPPRYFLPRIIGHPKDVGEFEVR